MLIMSTFALSLIKGRWSIPFQIIDLVLELVQVCVTLDVKLYYGV